ncbi:MAG: glycosyltransferase N-terminal domain-containing protein [Pseudomonadota bacterium]
MTGLRMPLLLRMWLLCTRLLSYPITVVSKVMHRRMGAHPDRFGERLGKAGLAKHGKVLWIHAASLGEVAQIGPLAYRLSSSENTTILITTTTQAGADWVKRELPDVVHQFVPVDTPSAVAAFLDTWDISVAIFVEGDLWPRLVLKCRDRGIPRVLLNARHSRTRERFPRVFATLLFDFSLITCRSDKVAAAVRDLGVPGESIKVLADLRTATAKIKHSPELIEEMSNRIGKRPSWLAASTHSADEAAVLSAHKQVLAEHPDALLILAPRHPKRAEPLLAAAAAHGLSIARRSTDDALTAESQIYLADTLGELGTFYALAPIAFIGGSLGEEGGHNPYEPASFGTAILSGPKVKNFEHAFAALSDAGAAELLDSADTLGARLVALIHSTKAKDMGDAGRSFMQASEDSMSTTVDLVRAILQKNR